VDTTGIIVVAAAVLGSGGIGGYMGTRPARSTRESNLIDQYQERYAEQEERAEKQDARLDRQEERLEKQDLVIDELRAKVQALTRREIDYRSYMYLLIRHIEDGAGPPPPQMPPALYRQPPHST